MLSMLNRRSRDCEQTLTSSLRVCGSTLECWSSLGKERHALKESYGGIASVMPATSFGGIKYPHSKS